MIQRTYQQRLTDHRGSHPTGNNTAIPAAPTTMSLTQKNTPGTSPRIGSGSPSKSSRKHLGGTQAPVTVGTEEPMPTSHFKQSYLINRLLYPVETDLPAGILSTQDNGQEHANIEDSTRAVANVDKRSEDDYLLHEMVNYPDVLGITQAELFVNDQSLGEAVSINPFVARLLLHGKLSYDEQISGVMAPSMAEVALTTWTLQVTAVECVNHTVTPLL
jgi:hypothetical protein